MLVDQDDTPLFLGAIHRTLPGTTLDALADAARAAGADGRRARIGTDALGALDSTHLVLTDGTTWHTVSPGRPGPRRRRVVAARPGPAPPARRRPSASSTTTTSTTPWRPPSASSPAVLLPSPDFEQVRALVESGGLLPEKATSFQPKPSLGRAHAADDRRMILADVASTSTRERVAPPAW